VDVVVCWRLDRLGRSLKHLITLLEELQALGVAFVSLAEGIDATTPAGKLQLHILGAIAEFERSHIAERVKACCTSGFPRFSWACCKRTRCVRQRWWHNFYDHRDLDVGREAFMEMSTFLRRFVPDENRTEG
jgi:hypothetical protein